MARDIYRPGSRPAADDHAVSRAGPGRYATWEPHRQTIETTEGVPIAGRPGRLAADLLGGTEFANYPSDYCEFDGILVPTRRRTHLRTADFSGTALAMDVNDIAFLAG